MFLALKLNGKLVIITLSSLLLFSFNNVLAHEWMAPKEVAMEKNPVKIDRNSIQLGKKSYSENCAYCHGNNAEGNESKSIDLKTNPPNMKKESKVIQMGISFGKYKTAEAKCHHSKMNLKKKRYGVLLTTLEA